VTRLPMFVAADRRAVPIFPVTEKSFKAWRRGRSAAERAWIDANRFQPAAGRHLVLPDAGGRPAAVVLGVADQALPWDSAALPCDLPEGTYRLEGETEAATATEFALGWALGTYAFDRYAATGRRVHARLVWPGNADRGFVARAFAATRLARDLINTPAADLGPAELADAARRIARPHGARVRTVIGDDLLRRNYPMIHAVGRASTRAPRLVDLRWGPARAPRVTLVGKGVCFDTGGLDLKPPSGMALMKKDMGGAAMALALAHMIMDARLPVRLRVLVPIVENSVSGNAFRPGDVLGSRSGLTVEIGNTDAEGRLILADALADADSESPALLVDFATLTGAARVAVGPEIAAMFTPDDTLAADLARHGAATHDPVWRMPLFSPYAAMLRSRVADINNAGEDRMAGAITAALFLNRFVVRTRSWVHFDIFAWSRRARPGRPEGGDVQALRATYALIAERYPRK
jgi:leucyl aminopeptidase